MHQMRYHGPRRVWENSNTRMWNGFRRSGKCLRWGAIGLTIGGNYLKRGNEWLWKYFEDLKRVSSDLSWSSKGFSEEVDKKREGKKINREISLCNVTIDCYPLWGRYPKWTKCSINSFSRSFRCSTVEHSMISTARAISIQTVAFENKAQRPTMRPQAFLGISSYRDERDARRKSEYGNSHLWW